MRLVDADPNISYDVKLHQGDDAQLFITDGDECVQFARVWHGRGIRLRPAEGWTFTQAPDGALVFRLKKAV